MNKTYFRQKHSLAFIVIGAVFLGFILYCFFINFQFNQDMVWRIDEERREHLNFMFRESRAIHNKFSSFAYLTLEIYLQYLSPLALFTQTSSFAMNIFLFGLFLRGIVVFLKSKLKVKKALGFWILIYPIFLALNGKLPSQILIFPITIPFVLIGFSSLTKIISQKYADR